MDGSVRGMPLLSGPAPHREDPNSNSCRRCNKDFGLIFRSSKLCNFCGWTYCSSCADHQALMPRQGGGYDSVNVCSYCIEHLTITASSRSQLRGMPVSKLKAYLKAFNIQTPGALEKDDIIQAILDARQANGCLPQANEDYYRRTSVPDGRRGRPPEKRGFFDRAADAARQAFDIPAHQPQQPSQPGPSSSRPRSQPPPQSRGPTPQNVPPRGTPPRSYGAGPAGASARSYPHPGYAPYQQRPPAPNNTTRPNTAPRPSVPQQNRPQPPRRPSTPVPNLDALLNLPPESIASLSAHVLKEILHQNHVNARLILEKEELVQKVQILVNNERMERERAAAEEEREAIERQHRMMADLRARETRSNSAPEPPSVTVTGPATGDEPRTPPPADPEAVAASIPLPASPRPTPVASPPPPPPPLMERQGLCVVCQDAEANMALVDCGHLALCKGCSDLIWSTTRECPLCRTRIVTQERMLRIFKT